MRKLHIRNGRKFPPRIPQEELNERVEKKLTECGVDNVSQAKFTCEISKKVIGSKKHIYETLQSNIKFRDDEAWTRAYTLVFKFLEESKMQLTLETINTETQNKRILLSSSLDGINATSYLEKRIQKQLQSTDSFTQRVARFVKEEHFDEPQKQKTSKLSENETKSLIEKPIKEALDSKRKPQYKASPSSSDNENMSPNSANTSKEKSPSSSSVKEKEELFGDFASDDFKIEENLSNSSKKDDVFDEIALDNDEVEVNKDDDDMDIKIDIDDEEKSDIAEDIQIDDFGDDFDYDFED